MRWFADVDDEGRMKLHEVSLEVVQAEGPIVQLKRQDIEDLKARAKASTRRRSRICAHPGPQDSTHEMLVALARDTFIRPHVHPTKVESFHVMEGRMRVVLFEDDGRIMEVVRMGDFASGAAFYYRQTRPIYHTLLPDTDFCVFQEVTQGPFTTDGTTHAAWAPEDPSALHDWIMDLRDRTQGASGTT